MTSVQGQSLFALAITVLIVYRFARRELRERTIRLRWLWVRPAILIAVTAYLAALSVALDPLATGELVAEIIGGSVLGVIVGVAIVRNTQFAPADVAGAVRVRGNRITFGIWIAALAVRLVIRFVVPHGADPRAQLPMNCGLVAMVAVAFVVIALAFAGEIRRFAASPPAIAS
jgi:hypothetical protein